MPDTHLIVFDWDVFYINYSYIKSIYNVHLGLDIIKILNIYIILLYTHLFHLYVRQYLIGINQRLI